jgi:pimeloyl-ACP methyl ester carboxylesterase
MKKKRVLIIVHGFWKPHLQKWFFYPVLKYIADVLTSSRTILRKDYYLLANFLKEDYDEIKLFRWSGKAFIRDKEIERFEGSLKINNGKTIDIVAVSLGGYLVNNALLRLPKVKINKLLYIGAVHDGKHILKNVKKVINVYSKVDKLFFVTNELYEGIGNAVLKGENVINIAFEGIRHDALCLNKSINQKNITEKSVYEFYRRLLRK